MIEIQKFELINKGAKIAKFHAKIHKWAGFVCRECCYFESAGKKWITLPSRQYEADGKTKFYELVAFEDRSMNDKFKESILKAVSDYMEKNCVAREPEKINYSDDEVPF